MVKNLAACGRLGFDHWVINPLTLNCTQVDYHRRTIKTPVICHLFHVPGVLSNVCDLQSPEAIK